MLPLPLPLPPPPLKKIKTNSQIPKRLGYKFEINRQGNPHFLPKLLENSVNNIAFTFVFFHFFMTPKLSIMLWKLQASYILPCPLWLTDPPFEIKERHNSLVNLNSASNELWCLFMIVMTSVNNFAIFHSLCFLYKHYQIELIHKSYLISPLFINFHHPGTDRHIKWSHYLETHLIETNLKYAVILLFTKQLH